jgi:hypothetical protein
VVVEDGVGKHIKTDPASPCQNSDYWFSDTYSLGSARPCWYQSGDTLRFIRKSTPPAESTEEGGGGGATDTGLEPAARPRTGSPVGSGRGDGPGGNPHRRYPSRRLPPG